MSDSKQETDSTKEIDNKSSKRDDSQRDPMQKRRNKPADTFMMDKEGFANRLKEMTVTGSTDAADSPLKKDCEIEKLDLSQVAQSDVLNNAIETSMVGDNEMHPGNDEGKYSKQLMDTCSVDTIKEAPFDIVEDVEEMTKSKEPTADASDVDDSSITKEKINNRVDAQRDTEDDDSQIRKWSTATFSDANSVISELRADMHTDTSALISSSRKRAESDAKEIMDTQNEKRSQSYIKKEVLPPIGKSSNHTPSSSSQPSKTIQPIVWTKSFWKRCPCDAIKRDAKLKTKQMFTSKTPGEVRLCSACKKRQLVFHFLKHVTAIA